MMENLAAQDWNKDKQFIPPFMDIINSEYTSSSTVNNDVPGDGPFFSPILIFFFFLILDVFIVAGFYFCYFMYTKSKANKEQTIRDKPPPYQVAIMDNVYPVVRSQDEESSTNDLPSYNDSMKNSHRNLETV